MKKIISFLCALLLIVSVGTIGVFAEEEQATGEEAYHFDYLPEGVEKPTAEEVNVLDGFIPESDDFLTYDLVSVYTVRKVAVTEPCDQTWRTKYPDSWMWEANRVVTTADDFLTSRYGIQFYSVAQKAWSSNSTTDANSLLTEAKNEWGLSDGAKLMIAFTDRTIYKNGNPVAAVNTGVGTPYILISCYGFTQNAFHARHEAGHSYGLGHCSGSCFMNSSLDIVNQNSVCSTHDTQLINNKTRY